MAENALRFEDVCVRFGDQLALDHVSATIPRGAMVALVGPNGAGKTTLIEAAAGLRSLASGRIVRAEGGVVALMRQTTPASRDMPITVAGFVAGGLWRRVGLWSAPARSDRERVRTAIDDVGLSPLADRLLAELSIGQRQRAAFARAIVQDADILLLDEPFAAIDAAGAERLVGLLDGWRRRGCTILAAMHDLALVRRHFPLAILLARRVIAAGPTAQALAPDKLDEARRALDEGFTDALCTHHDHGVLQP
jgi:zinc/manganese transport system ATP-binding protein